MAKNRLSELRNEKGMTFKELSMDMKHHNFQFSADGLAKYERGAREPKLEMWQKLASYFDVPVDYLMGVSDRRYSVNTLNWLHQYADEQEHYKKDSIITKTSLNTNDLIGAAMDILGKSENPTYIIGDEKETENILLLAGKKLISENFFDNMDDNFENSVKEILANDWDPMDKSTITQTLEAIAQIIKANPRDAGLYSEWFGSLSSFVENYKNLSEIEKSDKKESLLNELSKLIDENDKK